VGKLTRIQNLLIEPENAQVQRFYERWNYQRDELIFEEIQNTIYPQPVFRFKVWLGEKG
jgi:nitrate reductase beta subunit